MEKVYVENDWYDGPRKGIADFNGVPHRFIADFADDKGFLDTFRLFPINESEFNLEKEQWAIFVEWNDLYEKGVANTDSHPGGGGINKRWDEIESLLSDKREIVPENHFSAEAEFQIIDREKRYDVSGPGYSVVWKVINKGG